MKFSKHFPSSSSMSGFANHPASHQPGGSQPSAPPSALDIVHSQSVSAWDSLLSPAVDGSAMSTHEDSDLIDSPSFILGAQPFSPELDNSGAASDAFSWDSASFSPSQLRPASIAMADLHTPTTPSMNAGAQPSVAFASIFPLMSLESTNYGVYPYTSYPLLPVLSAAPYEVSSATPHSQIPQPTTISPSAVSLSQIAPPRAEPTPSTAAQPMVHEPTSQGNNFSRSRETSMEVDEDIEGDYDEDDMDEEDAGDEYKERSRGGRKDQKSTRPVAGISARKADTASDSGASSAKRQKIASSSKHASGSEDGTPAPTKRRGGNRIAVADFVPPDVSGLSKREARLVKNRAAAFLSRQRKREEFELMEVRLQDILEENARLKNQASSASPAPSSSAIQQLQEKLREAEERENALKRELEEQTRQAEIARLQAAIKREESSITAREALEMTTPMMQSPRSDISSLDGSSVRGKDSSRGGPGFNLMVLVFSLTLLSMPHQHQLQASMRGTGSQPTRIAYEPSGSSAASTFPTLFENVLERWEGTNRIETLDGVEPIDEDDEMEVEVEPWEQEEESSNRANGGNSYVVDFEMPVLADQVGQDDKGKIKVRISPYGVPRPRKAVGGLKPGELAWDGTTLPPVGASGTNIGSSAFAADWESWGGWKEFLSDDVVGTGIYPSLAPEPTSVDEAFSPRSEMEQSITLGTDENNSERWATPPPFPSGFEMEEPTAESAKALADNTQTTEKADAPVDVDVALSSLPAWSRAMIQAVAGEKLKARIRVSKKVKVAGRSRNSIALGKKRMGLVLKV